MDDWEPAEVTKHWSSQDISRFCDHWQKLAFAGAQKCDEVEVGGLAKLAWSQDYKRAISDFGAMIGKPAS